ncbi:MAG: hypothetical protein M3495_13020 [Pseudomonadota bacterium]|nr:hypothetical protein [Pseudomonadota bacterium]
MATENTLVIRNLASLHLWRQRLLIIIQSRNLPAVQFQFQEFSSEQNQRFSALANTFQKACGCASSGFLMSVTVVAIVVSYFVSGSHLSDITLPHLVSFVGIAALAALSGKVLGLFWARWRVLRLSTSIETIITNNQRIVTESLRGEA